MIPCTDFIPAYSELFAFLEEKGGRRAVQDFWNWLSDAYLGNLRDLVRAQGIRGCWSYWSHTLNEESADFTMTLDEEAGRFTIEMHRCPSRGLLLRTLQIEPYHDYCGHCDVLYRRVLEPLGYDVTLDLRHVDEARCSVVIRAKRERTPVSPPPPG